MDLQHLRNVEQPTAQFREPVPCWSNADLSTVGPGDKRWSALLGCCILDIVNLHGSPV